MAFGENQPARRMLSPVFSSRGGSGVPGPSGPGFNPSMLAISMDAHRPAGFRITRKKSDIAGEWRKLGVGISGRRLPFQLPVAPRHDGPGSHLQGAFLPTTRSRPLLAPQPLSQHLFHVLYLSG